jgi:toxin-antitoxin system PIN domain toxin
MKKGSSELILPDVNVLIALAWPNHQFHSTAIKRLGLGERWATCVLTQLGFIRLSSNPTAVTGAVRPGRAAELLAEMVSDRLHVYLPSPPPAAGSFTNLLGHRQVTDAYLIQVASEHDARLLTFDARLREFDRTEVLA